MVGGVLEDGCRVWACGFGKGRGDYGVEGM